MASLDLEAPCSSDIALEERLDFQDPLRHLMHQQDHDLQDVISADGLARPSVSVSELLNVLPHQHHSIEDGVLRLSCLHQWHKVPNPLSIILHLDASPGCGGLAWPAGQILASYLVQKGPEYFRAKTVVELGSGTGLVGLLVGSFRNADVWITDQAPMLGIMKHNVALNQLAPIVQVAELNWGSPPTDIRRPDIILAADCVYFEPAFPLLVKTLDDLSDQTTVIFFCYKKRRKADKRFFGFLKKKFTWKEVTDDSNLHTYNREGITLLRLFKI